MFTHFPMQICYTCYCLKWIHPHFKDMDLISGNEMGHIHNAIHWLRLELGSGRCVRCVHSVCACVCVFVFMLCERGGLVGGEGAVKLQGKMLMLTPALKLKMEWDFCKKLSITNGLE